MGEINQAYEVLSNEELRIRFDNGDDPNDQQSGFGGGNPFAGFGGGFPFGGQGGQFRFSQGQGFQQGQGGGQRFHFQF